MASVTGIFIFLFYILSTIKKAHVKTLNYVYKTLNQINPKVTRPNTVDTKITPKKKPKTGSYRPSEDKIGIINGKVYEDPFD